MKDNQMAAAGAMKSFFNAVGATRHTTSSCMASLFTDDCIEYVDPDAPLPSASNLVACLPDDVEPLLDTIHVVCGGSEVPQSDTDGWPFDPATDCFELHGSYQSVDGSTCTEEYF
jgi:hypothetical protein